MIAASTSRADQAMKPTRIAFPVELQPFEFEGGEGIPSACNVLIVRTLETATVVLSEMPDHPGSSLANNFERAATRLYIERLHDLPAWRIRWYTHSPARSGQLETVHAVTLEWLNSASSDGGFCFRGMHWRALHTGEVLVLLQDLDNDIHRFGVPGGVDAAPKLAVLRTELRQARNDINAPLAVGSGHPLTTISAAINALFIAQQATVHGDLLKCYSRIRAALEYLDDAKLQINGTTKNHAR